MYASVVNHDVGGVVRAARDAAWINWNKLKQRDLEMLWRTAEMTKRAREIGQKR